jgi:hypothetical protein
MVPSEFNDVIPLLHKWWTFYHGIYFFLVAFYQSSMWGFALQYYHTVGQCIYYLLKVSGCLLPDQQVESCYKNQDIETQ